MSNLAFVQVRHTENVPNVEPFPIPIRSENASGFRGVTSTGRCWQVKQGTASLCKGSTERADLPRLAVVWAQHQLRHFPERYENLFREEWLRLWMHDLADISCNTTSEDVIKHWGG